MAGFCSSRIEGEMMSKTMASTISGRFEIRPIGWFFKSATTVFASYSSASLGTGAGFGSSSNKGSTRENGIQVKVGEKVIHRYITKIGEF